MKPESLSRSSTLAVTTRASSPAWRSRSSPSGAAGAQMAVTSVAPRWVRASRSAVSREAGQRMADDQHVHGGTP